MTVMHSTSMDYGSSQFGNPAFLQALITNGSVTLTHQMLDWKYVNRREAQLVLPFLYIGPLSAAKDEKFVREGGFTLLVSVRSTASGPARTMDAVKMAALHGIQSYNIDVDSPTDLIRKFPLAIKAINDHLEYVTNRRSLHASGTIQPFSVQGKVLVICESGNERSAAFVAAYLMAVFSIDLITAIQTVQSQRFSVCIDDPIKNALGTFETLLSAKRDVGRANRRADGVRNEGSLPPQHDRVSTTPARSKRSLDSFCSDDGRMGTTEAADSMLTQGQQGRMREAPFLDKE